MSDVLSMSRRELKNIDEKSKLTIYGFIRKVQALLPQNNTFYTIPLSIGHIILLFYFEMDEFELFANGMELSADHKTVIKKHGGWRSAYGKIGINSQRNIRCFWKIKIIKEKSNMFIGLVTKRNIQDPYQYQYEDTFYTLFNDNWNYTIGSTGCAEIRDNEKVEKRYGKKYVEGDIVTMFLDLRKKEIHFAVNDEEYDIAFDDVKTGPNIVYYLGISITAMHHEMGIVDFGYY